MNNTFWVKSLAAVLFVVAATIAITWAWGAFIAEPYRDQGRAEVQAKWDRRESELSAEHAKNLRDALYVERKRAQDALDAANKRIREIDDEKTGLANSLDAERRVNKRLRTYTGKVVASSDGVPGVSIALTGSDATCEARLPAEIGEGFERLRESVIRIGSEANELAIRHAESQKVHRINGNME